MSTSTLMGIAVAAIGAVLLGFAYQASNASLERLSNTLTGRLTPPDHVVSGARRGAPSAVQEAR